MAHTRRRAGCLHDRLCRIAGMPPHPVKPGPSSVSQIYEIILEHKVQAEDIRSASVGDNMFPPQECRPDGKPGSRTVHEIAFRILCFFEIGAEGTTRQVDRVGSCIIRGSGPGHNEWYGVMTCETAGGERHDA